MARPVLTLPSGAASDRLELGLRLPRLLRIGAAPVLVLIASAGWLLLRGIDHRFISFSDGVYMYAAADAAGHGFDQLYQAVALSLPPGGLVGAALVWKLSPHVEAIRIGLAVLGGLTAVLTYRVARTLFGLGVAASALAAFLALAGPLHAQFVGLEGEAFITPLALALALAVERRRGVACVAILGLGFLFKLTWAPFFLLGAVALVLRLGARKASACAAGGLAFALVLYVTAAWAFGWSAHELATQLLFAQSRSGFQPGLALGIAAAVLVMWWPLLLLAGRGWRAGTTSARFVIVAGAASSLFMLKQGTFFNVIAPLEPFLGILAVAGACALWERGRPRARLLVLACALGAAVHIVSVTGGPGSRLLPIPLGAAIVNTDNQAVVDEVAAAIAAHSRPDQPVLVNPLFALVAHRTEPVHAVDWFILRSLERYCGGRQNIDRHCDDWAKAKGARSSVVGVDSNVSGFDRGFETDTGVASMIRLIDVDEPPIKTRLYARP
jgi:hypothetical protein